MKADPTPLTGSAEPEAEQPVCPCCGQAVTAAQRDAIQAILAQQPHINGVIAAEEALRA